MPTKKDDLWFGVPVVFVIIVIGVSIAQPTQL